MPNNVMLPLGVGGLGAGIYLLHPRIVEEHIQATTNIGTVNIYRQETKYYSNITWYLDI